MATVVVVVLGEEVVAISRARHHDPPAHRCSTPLPPSETVAQVIGEERVRSPRLHGTRGGAHAAGEGVRRLDALRLAPPEGAGADGEGHGEVEEAAGRDRGHVCETSGKLPVDFHSGYRVRTYERRNFR